MKRRRFPLSLSRYVYIMNRWIARGDRMRAIRWFCFAFLASVAVFAGEARAAPGCPRPDVGDVVSEPQDLYSKNGVLNVTFNYYTQLDDANRSLFCFVTDQGFESPTLHVQPGDTLTITLNNDMPTGDVADLSVPQDLWDCGTPIMTNESVNIHFHGTNTRPICHADGVVHTLVNPGQSFVYHVQFPANHPPGLYWYHPHVHGLSEIAVQGGATGAIIVEGIEKLQPKVSGLPTRVLIIRDQRLKVPGMSIDPGTSRPDWDVSLNYVPIEYPVYVPSKLMIAPGEKEFWRVANTAADTTVDIDLNYDGVWQNMEIVAIDGVPVGSHDGRHFGSTFTVNHFLLPPAARVEFITTMPTSSVHSAIFETQAIDTGPAGDNDLARPIAQLLPFPPAPVSAPAPGAAPSRPAGLPTMPVSSGALSPQRYDGIDSAPITAYRQLYFSEQNIFGNAPAGEFPVNFFLTVVGQKPTLFSPDNPPAIITTQGAVEIWTIENRTQEVHMFHMHQLHYELLAINGQPVASGQRQMYDTIETPYWSGTGPYPSITVKMDFRGDLVGDFVYHCHILGHEDGGMMAIIRVLPKPG